MRVPEPRRTDHPDPENAKWLAAWRESEDLIQLGAYAVGTNPLTDAAIAHRPAIQGFLKQAQGEGTPLERTVAWLLELATGAARPEEVR